jgi:organic hydroperoxide reductase OsmC/OhrA
LANREHNYRVSVRWTGNSGTGTSSYRAYARDLEITAAEASKPSIPGSSDPAFRGDPTRWNPEELFLASVSACHELWYLHLCASAGVVVTGYVDQAEGVMNETADGSGAFTSITLKPEVTLTREEDVETARKLHAGAHEKCFIANSIKTPVTVEPLFRVEKS